MIDKCLTYSWPSVLLDSSVIEFGMLEKLMFEGCIGGEIELGGSAKLGEGGRELSSVPKLHRTGESLRVSSVFVRLFEHW